MDKMIHGTHKYSRRFSYIKYFSITFLSLALLVVVFVLVEPLLGEDLERNIKIIVDIGLILITITISVFAHFLFINKIYDIFSTMAYMSNELDTKVGFSEANFLKQIFEPEYNDSDTWESMQGLKHLPENMRSKTAIEVAKKLLSNPPKPKPATPVKQPVPTKGTPAKPNQPKATKPKTPAKK